MQITTFKPTCGGFIRDQHSAFSPRTPSGRDTSRLADEIPTDAFFHRLELLTELSIPFTVTIRSTGVVQMYKGSERNLSFIPSGMIIIENGFSCPILKTGIESAWLVHNPTNKETLYSFELYDTNGDLFIQVFPESGRDLAVWNDIVGSIPSLID